MVVGQVVRARLWSDRADDAALDVNTFDGCLDEPGPSKGSADWLRAMSELQPSRARFEQQRREDEEILAADERDLDVCMAAERSFQVTRRGHATESPSEHDDAHGSPVGALK